MEKQEGGAKALSWWSLVVLMTLGMTGSALGKGLKTRCYDARMGPSVYNFTLMDIHNEKNISLGQHAGKVVLVINTASF